MKELQNKLKHLLLGRRGEANLVLMMFFILSLSVIAIMFIKSNAIWVNGYRLKQALREACIDTMTNNYNEIYSSSKVGYSGAYTYDGNSLIDQGQIYSILREELGTSKIENGVYAKMTNKNEVIYSYSNLNIDISNTGFRNKSEKYTINLSITYTVPISIFFISKEYSIELNEIAYWQPKF